MMKFKYIDLYKIPKVLIPLWLIGIIPYFLFYLIYIVCFYLVKGIVWLFTPMKYEFRFNYSSFTKNHPHLIFDKKFSKLDQNGNKLKMYRSIGLTSSSTTNGMKNIKLKRNPNKRKNNDEYMRDGIFILRKTSYGKRLKDYKIRTFYDRRNIQKLINENKVIN